VTRAEATAKAFRDEAGKARIGFEGIMNQEGGYVMRKLVIVAAATVSLVTIGLTVQEVSAQTWRGAKTISSASQNFTWIEPIACTRDERCPKGRHWRYGKCVLC
jgi:hypothetical protein